MKKLVCIGGGEIPRIKNGIQLPYETKGIDEEIVKLSEKDNPKFLFIGIASTNYLEYFSVIGKVYENLGCSVSLFDPIKSYKEMREDILNTDIIYVGGGNTRYLLDVFREKHIDELLLEAYEKGIVCSGLSAGSYCWFKCNYDLIEGLGIVDAVHCVHYDQKDEEAKNKFFEEIKKQNKEGIALDNCVALELVDGERKIIKSNNDRHAYFYDYKDGELVEKVL